MERSTEQEVRPLEWSKEDNGQQDSKWVLNSWVSSVIYFSHESYATLVDLQRRKLWGTCTCIECTLCNLLLLGNVEYTHFIAVLFGGLGLSVAFIQAGIGGTLMQASVCVCIYCTCVSVTSLLVEIQNTYQICLQGTLQWKVISKWKKLCVIYQNSQYCRGYILPQCVQVHINCQWRAATNPIILRLWLYPCNCLFEYNTMSNDSGQ